MDGYLSNKPKKFADGPENFTGKEDAEALAKKLQQVDPKDEADTSSTTPRATPLPGPKEKAPPQEKMLLPMLECMIKELCITNIRDLLIQDFNHQRRACPSLEKKMPTFTFKHSFNFATPLTCKGWLKIKWSEAFSVLST